ncbi:MAG: cytochrome c [Chthoniobacterales bacterium]|nr:cytochrome c [Chthoniobacterales bacterium]
MRKITSSLLLLLSIFALHTEVAPNRGKVLYETRCALCHGIDGRGS